MRERLNRERDAGLSLHLPFLFPQRQVRVLGPVVEVLVRRWSTPGITSRFAAP